MVGEADGNAVGEAGIGLGEGEGGSGVLVRVGWDVSLSKSHFWICGWGVGVAILLRDIVKQDVVVTNRRMRKRILTRFNMNGKPIHPSKDLRVDRW
jgi:hypothetical protein